MRQVTILDFPLKIGVRARQHRESLLREFAIIALGGGDKADVPKRLLEIAKLHDERYSDLNPEADDAVDRAISRGEEFIDFVVNVPQQIKQDTVDLAPVLIEVDAYCRSGDLLTLSPPDDIRALPVRGVRVEGFFGARGFGLVVFGSVSVNVVGLQLSEDDRR